MKYLNKLLTILFYLLTVATVQDSFGQEKSQENIFTEKEQLRQKRVDQYRRMKGYPQAGIAGNFSASGSKAQTLPDLENVMFAGPENFSGRVRALLLSQSDTSLIFAGGTTGGLWKSTNSGATWVPVDDQAVNLNVTCITQNPFNDSILYYGTGETTGNHTGQPGAGIFKSTDKGNTFTLLPSTTTAGFELIQTIRHSLTDSSVLYAGTTSGRLYKSTNGGNTFKVVFKSTSAVNDIECYPDGSVMAGIENNGVYYSASGDTGTFTLSGIGQPSINFKRVEIAYCQGNPLTVYACYGNKLPGWTSGLYGVWKSIDGGQHWLQISNPDDQFNFYFPNLNMTLEVKPDNPDFLLCGGAHLTYSDDGGTTWKLAAFDHTDQHAVVFNPLNTSVFYNGNDGGVNRYSIPDIDTATQDLRYSHCITQFFAGAFFPTGNSFLAGTQDNFGMRSLNGNLQFQQIKKDVNMGFCAINQQNPQYSYMSENSGVLHRSTNSLGGTPAYSLCLKQMDGDSDGYPDDEVWPINPIEINMQSGNQLFYPTMKRIWRTNDHAANWTPITDTITGSGAYYCIGLSNEVNPTLYCGGEAGVFIRIDSVTNASPGQETDLHFSLPGAVSTSFISCLTVHPLNAGTVYACFSTISNQPAVWRIDSANTATPVWNSISGNLPTGLSVNWIVADYFNPDSILVIATDFGLYTTVDGGSNWQKAAQIPNVSILNIRLRFNDRKLFIFTHGRGVWTADLPRLCNNEILIDSLKPTIAYTHWPGCNAQSWLARISEAGTGAWDSIATSTPDAIWDTLLPLTTYEMQIQGVFSNGYTSAMSASKFFTTPDICEAATALFTDSISDTSAWLFWTNTTASDKIIRYRLAGVTVWTVITLDTSATSLQLTGLLQQSNYEWQISSVCDSSTSGFSTSLFFTTTSTTLPFEPGKEYFNIWPTPSVGTLYLKSSLSTSSTFEITITDACNRIIKRFFRHLPAGNSTSMLFNETLPSGVYFITIKNQQYTKTFRTLFIDK